MGDIAQIEQLHCSEMRAHGGSHFACVHARARVCVCVRLHCWVIQGTKRALTLTGCCRSDEKIVLVCGSQSDSPPLQVSTEEEVLRWRNVRRAAILPLERSGSSKGMWASWLQRPQTRNGVEERRPHMCQPSPQLLPLLWTSGAAVNQLEVDLIQKIRPFKH